MRFRNHGIPTRRITATAIKRGTVVNDWSWRLVNVWMRLRTKLSSAAAMRTGADKIIASFISWRKSSATISGVIVAPPSKALEQRCGKQIPPIHHHKQQDLQGRRHHHRRQLK